MSEHHTNATVRAEWDLAFDDAWFLPLPAAEELTDAEAGENWVRDAVAHWAAGAALTTGDLEALRVTARGLLLMADPGITQLWFTPPAVYSDVLVQLTVGPAESASVEDLLFEIGVAPDSAASELIAIDTDTHGRGVLLRRTSAVAVEGAGLPIANWTVLLKSGPWLIRAEAFGATLESFALMEEHLPRLLSGITLPPGDAA